MRKGLMLRAFTQTLMMCVFNLFLLFITPFIFDSPDTQHPTQSIAPQTLHSISLVSNIILSLAKQNVPITDSILIDAYDWTVEQGVSPTQVLEMDVGEAMVSALVGS